jgi:predicted CXXCH cytochrome family protein
MRRPPAAVSIALVALAVFAVLLPLAQARPTAGTSPSSVQIPGATRVGSDICVNCHTDIGSHFRHAFHAQQGLGCEDCHGPGSLHVQGGGDVTKILSPSKLSAAAANSLCLECHARDPEAQHWAAGPHAANRVRCIDCHQVHADAVRAAVQQIAAFDTSTRGSSNADFVSPETDVLVQPRSVANTACLRCHQTQAAQLSMPYHHPLLEGKMSCVDCHDPHGGPSGNNLRLANVNQLCLSCHAQYRGPFAYQHPPVSENCLNCHSPHGSPNTNLLVISEPALCLQCHSGHHNGANLPLTDRCTNCHSSIHGTDVATPSGGSRFIDKGPVGVPSEPPQPAAAASSIAHASTPAAHIPLHSSAWVPAAANTSAELLSGRLSASPPAAMFGGSNAPSEPDPTAAFSSWSLTPASYRFIDGSGFLGRVGEYDSLEQSPGADSVSAFVSPQNHLTLVSRGAVIAGNDYSLRSQLTVSRWLRAGLDLRSLVQQQDHYRSYLALLSPADFGTPGAVTDSISSDANFALTRRIGSGYATVKLPHIPAHIFVKGNWQARTGESQIEWLDENSLPAVYIGGVNTTCGVLCHQDSHFQPVNYTTRNVSGGGDVELRRVLRLSYEHTFSSFNDRLTFPIADYTGPFTPENEGFSVIDPPPSGPAPTDFPAGDYYLDIPAPSHFSADSLRSDLTLAAQFAWSGSVTYTRLRDTFTHNPQNWFDSDQTVTWHPAARLRLIADYHQQNLVNDFTPYYTLYGNVSWHRHWEGLAADFDLPAGFSLEARYRRTGITRSNAFLWPQVYSMDNTDLQTVIPSSTSNTAGLALRYRASSLWNARVGYEFTGTNQPGYLIVPGSDNRVFADLWITPRPWLTFSNDLSIDAQNAFPADPLPDTPTAAPGFGGDIAGLPPTFQRRDRFYTDAASATLHAPHNWNYALGYAYLQNNLTTWMAFQNDASVNYVVDEPNVPFRQLTQAWWTDAAWTFRKRAGLSLAVTRNSSSSGYRPDLNPNDAPSLGNAALIQQDAFDPSLFASALGNLSLSSTQISEVNVPQWIGRSKAYYLFPYKIEGGTIFDYGSYRDRWNPNLNGALRTFDLYLGRSW